MVERKDFSCNYEANRTRVCEIYGVDPKKASVHHIVGKAEVKRGKLFKNIFRGGEVNEISNLYPFEGAKGKAVHAGIHKKQESMGVIYDRKTAKKKKKSKRVGRRKTKRHR